MGPEGPSNAPALESEIDANRDQISHTDMKVDEAMRTSTMNSHSSMENVRQIGEVKNEVEETQKEVENVNRNTEAQFTARDHQLMEANRQIAEKDATIHENQRQIEETRNEMDNMRHDNENMRHESMETHRQIEEMRNQNMETERQLNEMRMQVTELQARPHYDPATHHVEPATHHEEHPDDHHDENNHCEFGQMTREVPCDFQFDVTMPALTHHSDDGRLEFTNADLEIQGINGHQSHMDFESLKMNQGRVKIGHSTLDHSALDLASVNGQMLELDIESIHLMDNSELVLDHINAQHSKLNIDGVHMTASKITIGHIEMLSSTLELEPVNMHNGHLEITGVTLKCSMLDIAPINVHSHSAVKFGHINIQDSSVNFGHLDVKDSNQLHVESLTAFASSVTIEDPNNMFSHGLNHVTVEGIEVYGAKFHGYFTENGFEATCEAEKEDSFCRVGDKILAGTHMPAYESPCVTPPMPETPKYCGDAEGAAFSASLAEHDVLRHVCAHLVETTDNYEHMRGETCECLNAMFADDMFLTNLPQCTVSEHATIYEMFEDHLELCKTGEAFWEEDEDDEN